MSSCGIPRGAVILGQLHIVEFLDPEDGEIYKIDLSSDGDARDLPAGKYFELAEWARMMAAAPILADMASEYLYGEDDDGEDERVEV